MTTIPFVHDPNQVTDIVFQVGLNDLRRGTSPDEIQEKTLEMQIKYNEKIPQRPSTPHVSPVPWGQTCADQPSSSKAGSPYQIKPDLD